jgi:hypothetical protein
MELVAATYGRGIYKMGIRQIQQAFRSGVPQADILFETPVARLPWTNDTHRDRRASTIEKVPITFYLTKAADVTIRVAGKDAKVIWSVPMAARRGFNQFRWDLIAAKMDSPQPYFFRYDIFAEAGNYELQISAEGIDLKGRLTIVEREKPDF